jgi:hypothetical protein
MSASPNSLQQRYGGIERLYSERQWDVVTRLSEELLLELPGDPANPLRQRLQLLLGHTYLYGYQDSSTAAGFYSRVRAATEEPVLRDIADQGLAQCTRQTAPTAKPVKSTGAAMPWLGQIGGIEPAAVQVPIQVPVPNLIVEVVDEPELIEVAQADKAYSEELVVNLSEGSLAEDKKRLTEPVSGPSPLELLELSKGLLRVVGVASARGGG